MRSQCEYLQMRRIPWNKSRALQHLEVIQVRKNYQRKLRSNQTWRKVGERQAVLCSRSLVKKMFQREDSELLCQMLLTHQIQ